MLYIGEKPGMVALSVILVLQRLRQEDHELEGYITRLCLYSNRDRWRSEGKGGSERCSSSFSFPFRGVEGGAAQGLVAQCVPQ